MTLQQIRYILGVAEYGSLNKAAEKLFISQPSLTSTVHDAEDELGFEIFHRSSRGMNITEEGANFIRDAGELYAQYEALLKKYTGIQKKHFSVSTLYYAFARKAFVEIVKKNPQNEYDFAFWEKKASDVISDVSEGKSELGILYLSESNRQNLIRELNARSLIFHHLTECNAFAYLHKNHPLAKNESVSLDELSAYHFITFDTDDVNSFFSRDVIEHFGLNKPITVADRATELNLIEQLNGFTFLSGIVGEDTAEDFVLIPLQNPDGKISHSFELGFITKKNQEMDDISLRFIENVRKILNIAGFTC
ncbi:MAG: LysR family transcriptional regulator [Treponema sp.]|nr:LysR family transcriptional regulator [Treponema sp.]